MGLVKCLKLRNVSIFFVIHIHIYLMRSLDGINLDGIKLRYIDLILYG